MSALQLLARLRQPFGALLFEKVSHMDHKWVTADSISDLAFYCGILFGLWANCMDCGPTVWTVGQLYRLWANCQTVATVRKCQQSKQAMTVATVPSEANILQTHSSHTEPAESERMMVYALIDIVSIKCIK